MTNLPSASTLTDSVLTGDSSTVDDGSLASSVAAVAGRSGAGLARRSLKIGARGGSFGARAAYIGARATARGLGRGTAGTVRVARRHPKVSVGLVAALLAIAAYMMSRRSATGDSTSDHLSSVD